MMINPLGQRPKKDPQKVAQIKAWAAEAWQLSEDTPVMVTELQCTEPGCPPIETVIAILDTPGQPRQYKIFKPIADVTAQDVTTAKPNTENH